MVAHDLVNHAVGGAARFVSGGRAPHARRQTRDACRPARTRKLAELGKQPTPDGVDLRATRIRPDVVSSLDVRDVNIVLERLAPLADEDRFDLIVATNILVYYSVFEQSLALANVASMLRPGGFLLSNDVLVELPTTPLHAIGDTRVIYSDHPGDTDDIVCTGDSSASACMVTSPLPNYSTARVCWSSRQRRSHRNRPRFGRGPTR